MADKYFSVSCPKCGLGVDLEMGIFGWKAVKCPQCREKVTFDKARMQIVHCNGCDNDVVYDLARQNPCPICKRELVNTGEEHISVVCPDCDIVVELEKGMFGWKKSNCPKCGKKMRMKDLEDQLVECPTCKHNVIYNIRRKNNCPSCGGPLDNQAHKRQMTNVTCPGCQVELQFAAGDTSVTCPVCRKEFNPQAIIDGSNTITHDAAPDIRMTVDLPADKLVWKHPRGFLPLDARIISKPGYTAVVVQGDALVAPVNGQSVMLQETAVRADAYEYGEDGNKCVYVNVYYVRNAIDKASFLWGGKTSYIDQFRTVNEFTLFGTCELAPIVDHTEFLKFIKFNTEASAKEFATSHDARGVETTGDYAVTISKAMQAVYGEALRSVIERTGYLPAMLVNAKEQVAAEIERLANRELRKWGVAVQSLVIENIVHKPVGMVADPLLLRTLGHLDWQADPLTVHLKDMPKAMAQLQMSGGMDVEIVDENRLKSSVESARWGNPSMPESIARDEIGRHVGDLLSTMFTSVFQQLIEDMNPQLEMMGTYAGFLKAQAMQLLNGPDEFLARHGLCGKSLTLSVKVVGKSRLYELSENADTSITEMDIRNKLYEYEQDNLLERKRRDTERGAESGQLDLQRQMAELDVHRKASDAQTSAAIADMTNEARLEHARAKLEHDRKMASIGYEAEEGKARRDVQFGAWQDERRMNDAREEAERDSVRRSKEFERLIERDQAAHERTIHDIMRAVQESDQSWQEKLDAYARLQRNLAAQDELDQENAGVRAEMENQLFAAQQNLKLSRENAQLVDDLEKARFTRDLELRRQQLAEDMQRLQVEYEQENRQQTLESENEKLRLMLEYLAKMGDQQVAQSTMQATIAAAKAEADRATQQQHDAEILKRADAMHREQKDREDLMAARAYELTQQMMAAERRLKEMELENERAYASGRAMVDAKGRQYQDEQISALVEQMGQMKAAVEAMTKSASSSSGLDKWLEGLFKHAASEARAPQANVGYGAYGAQPGVSGGAATRICPFCHQAIPFSAIMCPHCKA